MLPTLPPEVLRRIFSLAASRARVGASPRRRVHPFLRALPLVSRAWRQFGQAELLREVYLDCRLDQSIGDDVSSERGYRLIQTLEDQPSLGHAVEKVVVRGNGRYGEGYWHQLLELCPWLTQLNCDGTRVYFGQVLSCENLRELALEDAHVDANYVPNLALAKLQKIEVTNAEFEPEVEPNWFPNLEALALLGSVDPSYSSLASLPTLRALIFTPDDAFGPDKYTLSNKHVLVALAAFYSHTEALGLLPEDWLPVHLRCEADDQAAAMADLLARRSPWLARLETVCVNFYQQGTSRWRGES